MRVQVAPLSLPGAESATSPLIDVPGDAVGWTRRVLRAGLPGGARVSVIATTDGETASGWAMRVVEARVISAGGEVVEERMVAFYLFLEHCAAIVVRARALDRAVVMAHFETARPDFGGRCLTQLWDLNGHIDATEASGRTAA